MKKKNTKWFYRPLCKGWDFKDKVVATELIRLYTNVSDLRESQKKLAIATGLKQPRPKNSKIRLRNGRFATNNND